MKKKTSSSNNPDPDLWRHKGGHGNKLEVGVTNQLPEMIIVVVAWEGGPDLANHRKGFSKL